MSEKYNERRNDRRLAALKRWRKIRDSKPLIRVINGNAVKLNQEDAKSYLEYVNSQITALEAKVVEKPSIAKS